MATTFRRIGLAASLLLLARPALAQTTQPASAVSPAESALRLLALPPPTDNAALDYWRAIGLMNLPPPGLDPAALSGDLNPTQVFMAAKAVSPGDVHFFAEEVRALHRGAAKPQCNFDLPSDEGLSLLIPHLGKLRDLTRRAVLEAKIYQAQADYARAAEILADTMQMGLHVASRGLLIDGLVGVGICNMAEKDFQWMFVPHDDTHRLDEKTAAYLLNRLGSMQPGRFDAAVWLRNEAAGFGGSVVRKLADEWPNLDQRSRLRAIDDFIQVLGMLRDITTNRDAVPKMSQFALALTLKADLGKTPDIVRGWGNDYAGVMAAVIALAGRPYAQIGEDAAKIEQRIGQETIMLRGQGMGNPLIAIMPEFRGSLFMAARGNALLRIRQIAVAAVLLNLRTGKYPADLEAIRPLFPAGLPTDPFTGKDFDYQLRDGKPVIRSAWQPKDDAEKKQMPVVDLSK